MNKLALLLNGVPFFLTTAGDIVIGAESQESIPRKGICLKAPLIAGGGVLKIGEKGEYFFSEVSGLGFPGNLVGRKLGVYPLYGGASFGELEVEEIYQGAETTSAYFYSSQRMLRMVQRAGEVALTQPSEFTFASGMLSSWNLSSLINAALIIYMAKTVSPSAPFVYLLCISGKTQLNGLFPVEFSHSAVNHLSPECGYAFGLHDNLRFSDLLPSFHDFIVPKDAKNLNLSIKVDNLFNLATNADFVPETVPVERVEGYLRLSELIVDTLVKTSFVSASLPASPVVIEVVDEAQRIEKILSSSRDFSEFLSSGLPKISEIYRKYGFSIASVKSSTYSKLREGVKSRPSNFGGLSENLRFWAKECIEELRGHIPNVCGRGVKIVTILMASAPSISVLTNSKNITVFISVDKIGDGNLKEVLWGEVSYALTRAALEEMGLPIRLAKFYSEGVRYSIVSLLSGKNLSEAIGLSTEEFEKFCKNISEISAKMNLYLIGDMLYLHKGKYHHYFKGREIHNPYTLFQGTSCGYGCFLAAVQTSELMASGKLYEKILSL